MYQNYDAIKLLLEERHREQLNLVNSLHQINGRKSPRNKSWITDQLREFIEGFSGPIFNNWLSQKPIQSTESSLEFTECQTTSDCQPC